MNRLISCSMLMLAIAAFAPNSSVPAHATEPTMNAGQHLEATNPPAASATSAGSSSIQISPVQQAGIDTSAPPISRREVTRSSYSPPIDEYSR